MLEPFYRIHEKLLSGARVPIRRLLMDEIDWSHRLIALTGGRGVGKTDFVLGYAKELEVQRNLQSYLGKEHDLTPCLYVNLSDFYFTEHSLLEFAEEFVKSGGKTLILDQTFKYENWSKELLECYSRYPDLHIIFVALPVMQMDVDNTELDGIVKIYNLRGFSFREYLNLQAKTNLPSYSLKDILAHHVELALEINSKVNPQTYFDDYLRFGYYPSYLHQTHFETNLMRTINAVLDTDILIVKQINTDYIFKLRHLLYIMLSTTPSVCNVSKIAQQIGVSRATTLNYIAYMREARLLNLLYTTEKKNLLMEKDILRKPSKVYMHNTNLAYIVSDRKNTIQDIAETYFYEALHVRHKLNATDKGAMFLVDELHYFDVYGNVPHRDTFRYSAIYNMNIGYNNFIPLWLFGFLY